MLVQIPHWLTDSYSVDYSDDCHLMALWAVSQMIWEEFSREIQDPLRCQLHVTCSMSPYSVGFSCKCGIKIKGNTPAGFTWVDYTDWIDYRYTFYRDTEALEPYLIYRLYDTGYQPQSVRRWAIVSEYPFPVSHSINWSLFPLRDCTIGGRHFVHVTFDWIRRLELEKLWNLNSFRTLSLPLLKCHLHWLFPLFSVVSHLQVAKVFSLL